MFKKVILTAVLVLSSASAFARAREYRPLERDITPSGYAIALGIPGELIDFEALDQDQAAADEFLETRWDKFRNFIVDLVTETKLSTIGEKDASCGDCDNLVSGTFGGHSLGNHYWVGITELPAKGLKWGETLLAVTSGAKWSAGVSEVLIVERENGKSKIIASSKNLSNEVDKQIRAKLTKKQVEALDGMAQFESVSKFDTKKGSFVKWQIEAEVPKSEDPSLNITAIVELSVVNGKITAKVLSVKVQGN